MAFHPRSHRPVSARHAFALAFDLAVRRDFVASLLVPLMLRAPFILIPALLRPLEHLDRPGLLQISECALVIDYVLLLWISSMLRFRARSVFNTPTEVHPERAWSCYVKALRRLPWLLVTEVVRNIVLAVATFFFVLPGIYLGYRLSCATESVVLDAPNLDRAFRRSFALMDGRLERWFEMTTVSALTGLVLLLVMAIVALVFPQPGYSTWITVTQVLLVLVTTVIQYAWTFFYLRLVEIEEPAVEEGPILAAARSPHLRVVEPEDEDEASGRANP
jgi:hypothetical protein